ncbi:MAG: PaaI family thioesterase [Cellvibrionales bacterium]|jgi:acyl-coenzyme A thioesterase PaaI-like protein|nr:PaaI family thioesterase [Cellvibrionales bacterium]MBK8676889.1 PaaI family thioesterase [Cellvibrionales bacterium]HRF87510.1 PaaI family thioesterase [Pseudomonadales bacterium]HRG49680.1 PaaI family thioesterase [Pseudomonadales bacterium]
MTEHALPINAMIDGDADRVAAALRRLNHTLVQKQLPEELVNRFAAALELLADDMESIEAPLRTRPFGTVESGESDSGSAYDYGAENSLSYRPISGNCNALAAPAKYFKGKDYLSAVVTFGPAFEGPPGLVHGGYIAAYMDEAFGIGIAHSGLSVPAMTGTLKTIYRLPVPLNRELVYQVRMTGEERRKVFMQCTVKDHDGTLYAEGEAIFLKIDPELYAKMGG